MRCVVHRGVARVTVHGIISVSLRVKGSPSGVSASSAQHDVSARRGLYAHYTNNNKNNIAVRTNNRTPKTTQYETKMSIIRIGRRAVHDH